MKIHDILKRNNIRLKKIQKIGKVIIISSDSGDYVIKNSHIDENVLSYLKSRNFDYIPEIIDNREYNITRYISGYNLPKEQKMADLIKLISLLHGKTTHYKEIDIQNNERIYNNLKDNINYLYAYYTDLISIIESRVFMSPSDLLFSSNITKLYDVLELSMKKVEKWHDLVSKKTRERNVIIHNNLSLDHFIRNDKSYLINWDKSRIDSPVFDLYSLYCNHFFDFNFFELLKSYEKYYPLLEDEKILLELLIEIPENVQINGSEYEKCIKINKILDRINSLPKTSKDGEEKKKE